MPHMPHTCHTHATHILKSQCPSLCSLLTTTTLLCKATMSCLCFLYIDSCKGTDGSDFDREDCPTASSHIHEHNQTHTHFELVVSLFSAASCALDALHEEKTRACFTDDLSLLDKAAIKRMSQSLLPASLDGCDSCDGWVSAAEGETIALGDLLP